MRITDLLTEDGILIGAAATTKEEAITMLVSGPERFGCVVDPAVCRADVLARESLGTTALSHGVAVPHAKSRGVKERGVTVMDGPSRLIFLLVGPENDPGAYLEMLSSLLQVLMKNPGLAEKLADCKSSAEFLQLLRDAESK